jgi:hypothetical protein
MQHRPYTQVVLRVDHALAHPDNLEHCKHIPFILVGGLVLFSAAKVKLLEFLPIAA